MQHTEIINIGLSGQAHKKRGGEPVQCNTLKTLIKDSRTGWTGKNRQFFNELGLTYQTGGAYSSAISFLACPACPTCPIIIKSIGYNGQAHDQKKCEPVQIVLFQQNQILTGPFQPPARCGCAQRSYAPGTGSKIW